MKKKVESKGAPRAIGPYSQAIKIGNLLFISGQIGIDPATGELVKGGVEEEVKRVMENIKAILHEASATFDNVIKTTIFLKDINDFSRVNEIYSRYFSENPPARSTIGVSQIPRGANVEIEAIAWVDGD